MGKEAAGVGTTCQLAGPVWSMHKRYGSRAVKERIGRRLLGARRTVAGATLRGGLGLEERHEEKKLLYGRR